MKNKRIEIFKWVMIGLSALILVSMFFNYVVIDFSAIAEKIGGSIGDAVGSIIGKFSGKKNTLTLSGLVLIKDLFGSYKGTLLEDAGKLLKTSACFVLIPYLCAAAIIVFSFFRKLWSHIASIAVSAVSLIVSVIGMLIVIPGIISNLFPDFTLVDIVPTREIRKILFQHTGPGWWITVLASAALIVLSILKLIALLDSSRKNDPDRRSHRGYPARSEGGIVCYFGELAKAEIQIHDDEELLIGSDPKRCNLIVNGPMIEPVHCSIRWDGQEAYYIVTAYAGGCIGINGRVLARGERMQAEPRDYVALSRNDERLRLI